MVIRFATLKIGFMACAALSLLSNCTGLRVPSEIPYAADQGRERRVIELKILKLNHEHDISTRAVERRSRPPQPRA